MSTHNLSSETKAAIAAAYQAGDALTVIAKRFGVSAGYVSTIGIKAGVPPREAARGKPRPVSLARTA